MDAAGAEELRKRLEEQAHWCQADAVRDGRQPATDPDTRELEGIGDGIRYYGRDRQRMVLEGRSALVTFRIVKHLLDGEWQRSAIQEDVEYAS